MGALGQADDMERVFDDPYKNLAAAILVSAVNDIRNYRKVEFVEKNFEPKGARARRYNKFVMARKEEEEAYVTATQFLMSDLPDEWFGINGKWMLRKIREGNDNG